MTIIDQTRPTTIKVSRETHQRLRAGATEFRSLDEYLRNLLEMEERQKMVENLRREIAGTPPELMESWRAESRAWENASLADAN